MSVQTDYVVVLDAVSVIQVSSKQS